MSGEWIKPSQSHLWVPPNLSRQSLVRVVNHTLLLIPVVPRLSTNVKSVKPWLTQYWDPPKTLKSRARSSKAHTTLNTGCVKILYRREIQWLKPSKTHFCNYLPFPSLSWQCLVRVINHTLLLIRKWQWNEWKISIFQHALFEHHRAFFSSDSCA